MGEIILPNQGATHDPTPAELGAAILALAGAVGQLQETMGTVARQQVAILNAVATADYVASEIAPYLNGERNILDALPPQTRAMLASLGLG